MCVCVCVFVYIYMRLGWDKRKSAKEGKTGQTGLKIFYRPYLYLSSMDPI